MFDFLLTLFRQSPRWVRVVIVLGIFTAVGFGIYKWIAGQSTSPKTNEGKQAYPLDNGHQVAPPGSANTDPRNLEATQKLTEDDQHFKWHNLHEKHEPEWNIIYKLDEDNYVEYKYYKDTDRCVLLFRKENGEDTPPRWIRDPIYGGKSTTNNPPNVGASAYTLTDLLIPTVHASTPQFLHEGSGTRLQSVQAGCVNPHPGVFQWWWGPPADQCWSPMYRRFGDGCTHHQMFNRCYNAWDANIIWDFCTGGAQHY